MQTRLLSRSEFGGLRSGAAKNSALLRHDAASMDNRSRRI